jgi:hypothetical protein
MMAKKIADHWTNVAPRGEPPVFRVTGWHYENKSKPQSDELVFEPRHKRGLLL